MEKKLYELPTIVIFDLDKDDTIRTSLNNEGTYDPLNPGGDMESGII